MVLLGPPSAPSAVRDHGRLAHEAAGFQAGQGEVTDLAGRHRAPRPEGQLPDPVVFAGRACREPRHPDQGPVQLAVPEHVGHPVGIRAQVPVPHEQHRPHQGAAEVMRVAGEGQVEALDHDQAAHPVPRHRGEDGGGALLQYRQVGGPGAADGADDGIGALNRTLGGGHVPYVSGGHRDVRIVPVNLAGRPGEGMDFMARRAGLAQDGAARRAGRPEQSQSHLASSSSHDPSRCQAVPVSLTSSR